MASVYKRGRDKGKRGSVWNISYDDENGKRRTVKGTTDKVVTQRIANDLEAQVIRRREGLEEPSEQRRRSERKRPIGEHLAEFMDHLSGKRNSAQHLSESRSQIQETIARCGWNTINDITAQSFQGYLRELAQPDEEGSKGRSARTINKRRTAVRGFTKWLVNHGRLSADPLASVLPVRQSDDRRHERRALTDDEAVRLILAAETGPAIRGLSGQDRAMLYRLAIGTGLRLGELLSLKPESFDLHDERGTVCLEAASSKRRKQDRLPLPRELIAPLAYWLSRRQPGSPLWTLKGHHGAEVIRKDLYTAGIVWDTPGAVLDFHALRHTFVTRLARSGMPVKTAQELARHSDPRLTMNVYSHIEMVEKQDAIDSLPSLNDSVLAAHWQRGGDAASPGGTGPVTTRDGGESVAGSDEGTEVSDSQRSRHHESGRGSGKRSERDSNPRYRQYQYNGLAIRPLQPLGHRSGGPVNSGQGEG